MNNMYLNEENYQGMNKKIKAIGGVIMFIALIVIIAGIFLKVQAMGVQVPSMGSENWFEITNQKSEMDFSATSLLMFGIFLESVGCMVRYFIGNRRQILAYNVQTVMPIAQEGIKTIVPTVAEANATILKTMAPVYGEVAKEVATGIREGLNK